MPGITDSKRGLRAACLERYREKKRNRGFMKRVRYEMRKLNAERRPRIKVGPPPPVALACLSPPLVAQSLVRALSFSLARTLARCRGTHILGCNSERTTRWRSICMGWFNLGLDIVFMPGSGTDTATLGVTRRAVQVDHMAECADKATQYRAEKNACLLRAYFLSPSM
jgi:CCT motif